MNILMLSYAIIPEFAQAFGLKQHTNGAGWIVGMRNALINDGHKVALISPLNTAKTASIIVDSCTYYTFSREKNEIVNASANREKYFIEVIDDFHPDAVVVFGTEFAQGLDMIRACEKRGLIGNTVIFIQGLLTMIKRYYSADLPDSVIKKKTISEVFSHMDISSQIEIFDKRSENEVKMLRMAKHVIGGTVWDRNVVNIINPSINYHYCPEILRDSFYKHAGKWSLEKCDKHSILSVQSNFYPLKGLHFLLEGFCRVHTKYPDAKLYVTINRPRECKTIMQKVKSHTYENYIYKLMEKFDLWESVVFLGNLNEKELVEYYLKANVFICPSSIENHSQTVSEAKIIGVPTIASFVGGVVERISHGVDGFLYQYNAPYMIAEYVQRIFDNKELTENISNSAKSNAIQLLNKDTNINTLVDIFNELGGVV